MPPVPLPPLLVELRRLLAAHRPAVHQARCFDRLRALVLGHLYTAARHTLTQVLLALGLVDADWSAFYRLFSQARLDYDVLTRCFVQQTLAQIPPEEPYMAVVDGVQLPRSSQRRPGTSLLPVVPGVLLTIAILYMNFIGDGLRDALHPRYVR